MVLSGGQGADEPTTEAMAMAEYLRYNGIEPERMHLETNSSNTTENMICSKALIDDQRQKEKEAARARRNRIRRQRMELDRFLMDMEKFREDQGAGDVLERPIVPGPVPSAGPGSREPIRIPPSREGDRASSGQAPADRCTDQQLPSVPGDADRKEEWFCFPFRRVSQLRSRTFRSFLRAGEPGHIKR